MIPERKRLDYEIIPVSAEQSATKDDNEYRNGAENVIDLDPTTHSWTDIGSDGTTWIKIILDKVHCIQKVFTLSSSDSTPIKTWTCTDIDCSNCVGDYCDRYTLTVSTKGAVSDLSPVSDCKYGDTAIMQRIEPRAFQVSEIAIVGKQGNLLYQISKVFLHSKPLVS